jgi:TP901 family phage tail tape measure protein
LNVFELAAKITLDTSEYINGLGESEEKTETLKEKIGNGLAAAAKIGVAALATATAAVVSFAASSVSTGAEFDTAMSQVAATMGTTTDSIQELRDYALEMGSTTSFSATQAAEALNYMALAGYDADTSMEMLPNVLNLAAAGGMELATASDMVTDAQSALGLTLDETSQMVDKMAAASSKSNTSVEQLGEAFLTIGGTAQDLAGGTTELSTALGILADNGIKGSEGGTHLRNVILALESPTDTAAAAMEELGLQVFDAEGNMRPLQDIMTDLNASMDGMTSEEKTNIISTIFNKTDISSVNALLGTTTERWEELAEAIDASWYTEDALNEQLQGMGTSLTDLQTNLESVGISADDFSSALAMSAGNAEDFADYVWEWSDAGTTYDDVVNALGGDLDTLQTAFDNTTGAAQAMADTQLDNLSGDITLFQSALEGAQIATSDQLTPTLREFVQFGSEGISELTAAFQEGGLSGAMASLGDVISDGLAMVLEMIPQVVSAGMQLLNSLVSGIIQNLPLLASAAVQIITSLASNLATNIPQMATSAAQAITQIATSLSTPGNLTGIISAALEIISALVQGIAEALPILIAAVPEIIVNIVETLAESLPDILAMGVEIVQNLITGIVNTFGNLVSAITSLIANFAQIPPGVKAYIDEAIENIKEWASNVWEKFKETGQNVIEAVTTFFSQIPVKILEFISSALSNVVTWATNMATKASETGTNFLTAIVSFFTQLPGKVLTFLTNTISNVTSWASSMASNATTAASNFLSAVVNGITNLPANVMTVLTSVLSNVAAFATSLISKGKEAASSMASGMVSAISGLPSQFTSIASQIITGMVNGIKNGISKVTSAISNMASNAVSAAKSALGIASPSKVFKEIGEFTSEGLSVGIENGADEAVSAAEAMVESVIAAGENLGISTAVKIGSSYDGSTGSDWITSESGSTGNVYDADSGITSMLSELLEAMKDLKESMSITLSIDGVEFATATAGATDSVNGARQSMKVRGLAL